MVDSCCPYATREFLGHAYPLGSGILTSSWRPDESLGSNAWFATALHYDFTAAAPVPEPTTVVLTGLAAAAAAGTRRRKRMR